jgi:hypothetical protein
LNRNIPAWGKVVGIDGAIPENCVETLKDFRGYSDEGAQLDGIEVDVS